MEKKKMTSAYPVIFTKVNEGVLIEVPDFDILTQGNDPVDAIYMARDAIGLKGITMEDDKEDIPKPTELRLIDVESGQFAGQGDSYISLVDVDFLHYRRMIDNKTVRRNVTLPNWLNEKADEEGINVSRILQEALMDKLGGSK